MKHKSDSLQCLKWQHPNRGKMSGIWDSGVWGGDREDDHYPGCRFSPGRWHVLLYNTDSRALPWANFSPPWSKNAFTCLNRWEKLPNEIMNHILGYVKRISRSYFSVNKFLRTQPRLFCYILSMAAFYATMTDFCHCKRDHVTCKTQSLLSCPLWKLFAYRCLQRSFFQGNGLYCSPFARKKTDTMTQQKSNQNSPPGFMTIYLCNPKLMEGLFLPPHPLLTRLIPALNLFAPMKAGWWLQGQDWTLDARA